MVVAVAAVLLSTHIHSALTPLLEDSNHHHHQHHNQQQQSHHLSNGQLTAERIEDGWSASAIARRISGSSASLATPSHVHTLPPQHHSSSVYLTQHHQYHPQQRAAHPSVSPLVVAGALRFFPYVSGSVSAGVSGGELSSRRVLSSPAGSHLAVSAATVSSQSASPPLFAGSWGASAPASGGGGLDCTGLSSSSSVVVSLCATKEVGFNNANSGSRVGFSSRRGRDVLAKGSSTTAFRSGESEKYSSSSGSPTQSPPPPVVPSYLSPPNASDRADDVNLHNPLRRLERLGCGWLGLIVEWEGVVVEDDPVTESKAWEALAEEEGRPMPLAFMMRRAEGMKNEQVLSQVLCWARDPREIRRLAKRKEDLYEEMLTSRRRMNVVLPMVLDFLRSVRKHGAPVALVSTRPRAFVEKALQRSLIDPSIFDAIVAAEDVERGKPDPEMYLYVAQLLRMIPERLIVVGNAHSSIEAAHEAGMKCVAVVGRHAAYELHEAEAVVRRLSDLSFQHLMSLVSQDHRGGLHGNVTPELQPEMEETEQPLPRVSFADW